MLKLFLPATITLLVTLATLTACSDPTPALEVPTPTQESSGTAAPASTDAPVSTQAPTERPTDAPRATPADAPRATPANSPTPEAINITAPPRVLAPLQALDSGAMFSELSDAEKECIGENPERQARFFGCLEDETVARIFLAGFVPGPRPLSQETSDCVRAAFEVIDPRAVMTADIEGNPGRAMAGSMAGFSVTIACLNDEEWAAAASKTGIGPDEREGMQCLLDQLGGPGEMAEAMTAAGEGDLTDLSGAAKDCGLDMGPGHSTRPRNPSSDPHGDHRSTHTGLHARDTHSVTDPGTVDSQPDRMLGEFPVEPPVRGK